MFKKIKTAFITLAVITTSAMAQSPSQINYQGAARDGAGAPIANQQIRIRLKVHDGTSGGPVQYSEVRKPTTNANGLFNIVIGSTGALSTTGSFAAITWESGNKYLQVEMDPTGGTSYTNMGTQQLVSVPYAQYANTAGALAAGAIIYGTQVMGNAINLPYAEVDSTLVPMFQVTNKNGNSLEGLSANGNGVIGYSSAKDGIYGQSNAASYAGVKGYNGAGGNGLYGESTTGSGIYGYSNSGSGVTAANSAAGAAAIYGANYNSGAGISGYSQNGIGVVGNTGSANWPAVSGFNSNGTGVKGQTVNGTGVEATSTNGYALKSNGKVQIAGGNTNPGKGKILTCDSLGNATWQGAVAFKEHGFSTSTISAWSSDTLNFLQEEYDLSNNYNSNTDVFVAPVSGLYHFDIQVTVEFKAGQSIYLSLYQKVALGGTASPGECDYYSNVNATMPVTLSIDCLAGAGDQFILSAYNYSGQSMNIYTTWPYTLDQNRFSGRLITKL